MYSWKSASDEIGVPSTPTVCIPRNCQLTQMIIYDGGSTHSTRTIMGNPLGFPRICSEPMARMELHAGVCRRDYASRSNIAYLVGHGGTHRRAIGTCTRAGGLCASGHIVRASPASRILIVPCGAIFHPSLQQARKHAGQRGRERMPGASAAYAPG